MAAGGGWRRPDRPIGYGRQTIAPSDVEAVRAVLEGERLTQGPAVRGFERALEEATGAPHAVALSSGTAALHVALRVLDIGPGARVVTSANTFLASATAALMCGAEAEFVDVDPRSGNLDPDELEARLAEGPPVDAVVAVYFAGRACDLERLLELRRRLGFALVVDGCHALGGTTALEGGERRLGELPGVDAVALSFHPVKHVTTGEGGALLFSDGARASRARRLREHGLDREPGRRPFADSASSPAWFACATELGYNYRLSDFAAALGTSQLARLDEFLEARRRIARRYEEALTGCRKPELVPGHAWHLYVVHVEPEERDELMGWLHEGGIGTQLHYYPVPLQPLFRRLRKGAPPSEADYPHAVAHARTALSLPIHPSLRGEDVDRVVSAFAEWRG